VVDLLDLDDLEEEDKYDARAKPGAPPSPHAAGSAASTRSSSPTNDSERKWPASSLISIGKTVRLLVERGGRDLMEVASKEGFPLLLAAVRANCVEAVKALVRLGIDLLQATQNNKSALHLASQNGHVELVLYLLQRGAQPNVRDLQMNTPLHLAANPRVATLLLANGARRDLENLAGQLCKFGSAPDPQLDAAEKSFNDAPETQSDKLSSEESDWLKDDTSLHCLLCLSEFTFTNRRHHCRRCGLLVCNACSRKRYRTFTGTVAAVRCCDGCFNYMRYTKKVRDDLHESMRSRMKEANKADPSNLPSGTNHPAPDPREALLRGRAPQAPSTSPETQAA